MDESGSSLDPNKYLIQLPNIRVWLKTKKYTDLNKEIGLMALATSLHIVVVSYFTGKVLGFTPEIVSKIQKDMKFYHIIELVGFDPSNPNAE